MDLGFSHIALTVRDVFQSIAFYRDFASFELVHLRGARGRRVAWLSDLRRPFALVLVESEDDDVRLGGIAHLGVACESREQVDALCDRARTHGHLRRDAEDGGHPAPFPQLLRRNQTPPVFLGEDQSGVTLDLPRKDLRSGTGVRR